jgi:hypothetical protein
MKTKITSRTEEKFVKLTRTPRTKNKEVYDIKPYSLFKLVDALSNGDVLYYIDYCILFEKMGVGVRNTMVNISKYLVERLDPVSRKQVFGNVKLETLNDFKRYFATAEIPYTMTGTETELRQYISDNFDFDGKSLKRKITSHYINV